MPPYARSLSTRLFIQAALTGFLAPVRAQGSTWLVVTFALAIAAASVGGLLLSGPPRARELVIGFEVVAVAVGVAGLSAHHYIPGTIIGVFALLTAIQHRSTAAAAPAHSAAPDTAEVADVADIPEPAEGPLPPVAVPAQAPEPVFAAAVAVAPPVAFVTPPAAVEAPAFDPSRTAERARTILPGR